MAFVKLTAGAVSRARTRARIDEWWNPWVEAWFPDGKSDPSVALLKVEVENIKALITKTAPDVGENRTVEL